MEYFVIPERKPFEKGPFLECVWGRSLVTKMVKYDTTDLQWNVN